MGKELAVDRGRHLVYRDIEPAEMAALVVLGRSADKRRAEIPVGAQQVDLLFRVTGDLLVAAPTMRAGSVTTTRPDAGEVIASVLTVLPEADRIKTLTRLEAAWSKGKRPPAALVDAVNGMLDRLATSVQGEPKQVSGQITGNLSVAVVPRE